MNCLSDSDRKQQAWEVFKDCMTRLDEPPVRRADESLVEFGAREPRWREVTRNLAVMAFREWEQSNG